MKNITLAIDDDVLTQVRDYAERHSTTVNGMVREYLADTLLQEKRMEEPKRGLRELIDNSTGRLGPDYKWNREENL